MTADTSAATIIMPSTATSMASMIMHETSSSASTPNPPPTTIFWQPCLSIQRPSGKSVAVKVPADQFVYPHPDHSSPTIVGVAVKRTLKSPDAPDHQSTDTSQCSAIAIVDSAKHLNSNNSANTSATLYTDQPTLEKPKVMSDIGIDCDTDHPLKDLFLRKLREKDVAYISERLTKNYFEETMLLLKGNDNGSGNNLLIDLVRMAEPRQQDTFCSTMPDRAPSPSKTTTSAITTTPRKSTTMTSTSHKHHRAADALLSPFVQPATTCAVTPSESKNCNRNENIAVLSAPWSLAMGNDTNNNSRNEGNCNDAEGSANKNIEGIPHLLMAGTTPADDTLDVPSAQTSTTRCKCLLGDRAMSDTTYCVRKYNEQVRGRLDNITPKLLDAVTASKTTRRTHSTKGDTFNQLATAATISITTTDSSHHARPSPVDAGSSNSTLLDSSAVTSNPTSPDVNECDACALHHVVVGRPSTLPSATAIIISPTTPQTTPHQSHPSLQPKSTATSPSIHSSIRPEVNDVTTDGTQIHPEAVDKPHNQPPTISCCSVATPLLPVVASSLVETSSTQQHPSRSTPSGTKTLAVASTEWAENLLAKLKQELRLQIVAPHNEPQFVAPHCCPEHGAVLPDTDVNLEHKLAIVNNQKHNNTNHLLHHLNTNNNHRNLAHSPPPNLCVPTPNRINPQPPITSECEQENGCHSDDDGRPDDADVVANQKLCHPDHHLLVQFAAAKCCSHHRQTVCCSSVQSESSLTLSTAIKQIQAIYDQSDISDCDVDDDEWSRVKTHQQNQHPETSSGKGDLCVSPGSDSFEASNRLRRLENRFRDLSFTKKLLVSPTTTTTNTTTTQTTTTTPNTSECFLSSAVASASSAFAQPTTPSTTTASTRRDNLSSSPSSSRHLEEPKNCCASVSSDAVRVRSAIDWATASSYYCLAPSATELGIPSAPSSTHTFAFTTNTSNPTPTATPNTVAVGVDATASSQRLLVECKHNHRQQQSFSALNEHYALPTLWRRITDEGQVQSSRARKQGIGDTELEREEEEEEEEGDTSKNKVENDAGIQLHSRLSTPIPDTEHIRKQSRFSQHTEDDFIEPDLIQFDDEHPLSDVSAANASLVTPDHNLPTDDSESDEISHLFANNNNNNTQPSTPKSPPPPLPPRSPQLRNQLLLGDLHTHCEFNVRHLADYSPQLGHVFECYDELIDSDSDTASTAADEANANLSDSNESCDCSLEAVPLILLHNNLSSSTPIPPHIASHSTARIATDFGDEMRESGTLRGLLKKPNRPPPTHKNRVVFDETQNKFFDADYIILIREDCPYDEEDEEPCTCGEHELVRLCCEDGCQCQAYAGPADAATDNMKTPQSPKFAPPIEFVDPAALSPPEGYKDGGKLANTLGNALGGHVFGAQHMQQLQVIQRLQAQRAAMLAARATNGQQTTAPTSASTTTTTGSVGQPQPLASSGTTGGAVASHQQQGNNTGSLQQQQQMMDASSVCTECAECAECAAKQLQGNDCSSPSSDDGEPKLDNVPLVALAPIQTSSPERRIIAQKEIIAGEERPRYLLINNQQPQAQQTQQEMPDPHKRLAYKATPPQLPIKGTPLVSQRYVVETITMTTVTERRVVREATTDTLTTLNTNANTKSVPAAPSLTETPALANAQPMAPNTKTTAAPDDGHAPISHPGIDRSAYLNSTAAKLPANLSTAAQISGILKGGKLWKSEPSQSDDSTNITSDDESSKRSVRFTDNTKETSAEHNSDDRELCDGESQKELDEDDDTVSEPIEPMLPPKKHSSIFHNALRPNSAVRQLFPATVGQPAAALTHEALRAFEEAKRSHVAAPVVHSDSETDTIRRTIERNALRRSLIKKKQQRSDNSLEERIRRLTCDVDDNLNHSESSESTADGCHMDTMERRDSPAGEENPQQPKYGMDKSFSPSSSVSSSSSGSTSAYRKITDIFNRDRRQERIPEADENPIVIIPQMQECRCPAAPDLGMGVQMPATHTQVHQTPPRQTEARRQFLSTLAPLTSCVAGQRDDLSSYYTLAPGERASTASSQYSEYSLGDIEAVLKTTDEAKKVAPDVIAGTPGQEFDELANFAQQESVRTERLKKRYSAEASVSAPNSNAGSDDDEQNDYGFNKRPSVRGIKPRFSSTNEILQQMQAQLSTPTHPQGQVQAQPTQVPHQVQSNTLPKNHSYMLQKSTPVQPQQPQQSQQLQHHHSQHNHQQQQHQHQPQQQPQHAQNGTPATVNQSAIVNQTHQQQIAAWNFYHEQQQRNAAAGYYQTLPLQAARHSFHGHEESTVYQNCQTVAMEQHHFNRAYARSPTRRPESPPPLRNYHQTMVLIPYNTESYAHFSSAEQQVPGGGVVGQQYQRHNVLEYQQVTQQTIRVPMGYPLPGMQLHVVAGRSTSTTGNAASNAGNAGAPQYAQYAQHQNAARGYAYSVTEKQTGSKFIERGVPEGAASAPHSDNLMSPTAGGGGNNQSGVATSAATGAVFYAMNV